MSARTTKSPAKDNPVALGFQRRTMVDWYSPKQLAQTGARAVISSMFGNYADKREMQAALDSEDLTTEIIDFTDNETLWIDYVSDMGAGWNSSYSVAYLLGRQKLDIKQGATNHELPRGNILVMGGDQVYPTPSWKDYNDRLKAPYRCSLPYVSQNQPSLLAIPGNHDWYDGLSSFLKMFCQKQWIGGWKTRQSRSYFACKLPHNWWLWGIDIQLNADIDKPQLDYFDFMCEKAEAGDNIILCTSEPSWVYQEYQADNKPWKNLNYFKKRYVQKEDKPLNFRLALTGDMHHYTSFKKEGEPNPDWRITAGGGGAFTHPTHQVPDTLHLEDKTYQRSAAFPDAKTSRKEALKNLKFPFINLRFGVFFGALYLFAFWMAASNSGVFIQQESFINLFSEYPITEVGSILLLHLWLLLSNPVLALLCVTIIWGFYRFADKNRKKNLGAHLLGLVHGVIQTLAILFALWLTSYLMLYVWKLELLTLWGVLLSIILMMVEGWLFSGLLMGFYLLTATLWLETHETEAFSSIRGENYKNFIRIKLDKNGLTLYPIKIPRTCKKWKYNAGVEGETPWYEPLNKLKYELIEDPIIIKKQ